MIIREFEGRVTSIGAESVDIDVDVMMIYEEHDPFGVQVVISKEDVDDAVWLLSRELLIRGVNSFTPVGLGDVKFRYLGPRNGGLLMCLTSPQGHADIWLPQPEVVDFLNDTTKAVPVGQEDVESQFDVALKVILGS